MKNIATQCAAVLALLCLAGTSLAGSLDSPAPPTDSGSAMYTGEDLYNRLTTGAAGVKRSGPFVEPSSGPAAAGHTLNEIMAAAPAADNANGAAAGDVFVGKTFWGLRTDGTWGIKSGTAAAGANVTGSNGALVMTIPNGLYAGSKTATASDSNLATGNIRSGVTIFGVSGNSNVVNTSGATATSGDILSGKTAYVGGSQITGNVPSGASVTGSNGALVMTIPNGLYAGSKTATARDANLVTGNIRAGTSIFSVVGASAVVNTSSGTAVAADISSGKIAWVNGVEITGTRPSSAYIRAVPVNATGITTWSDSSYNGLTDTLVNYPRQDADSRRGGFLFTKLDGATGATLADSAAAWGCVRDGVTGLTWEVKTADSGLHHNAWTYTWHNSNTAVNGGSAGTASGGACGSTVAAGCDTEKFVAAVNAAGWCGYTDWRMPTVRELKSIVNLGTYNPAIATAWFPNTAASYYWSSTPYASNPNSAWRVYFVSGTSSSTGKSSQDRVRLVRGGL